MQTPVSSLLRADPVTNRQAIQAPVLIGLLGALVEEVTKEPLDRFCERRIFEPLGMSSSTIELTDEDRERYGVTRRVVDRLRILEMLRRLGWQATASVFVLPPFIWFVELGYRVVANNRRFFSRFLFRGETPEPVPPPKP